MLGKGVFPVGGQERTGTFRQRQGRLHYLQNGGKQIPDYEPRPFMLPCRCVIDRDFFKLIEWADGRLELYDLNRDFEESRNLRDDPDLAPRVRALQQVMLEKLGPFSENA